MGGKECGTAERPPLFKRVFFFVHCSGVGKGGVGQVNFWIGGGVVTVLEEEEEGPEGTYGVVLLVTTSGSKRCRRFEGVLRGGCRGGRRRAVVLLGDVFSCRIKRMGRDGGSKYFCGIDHRSFVRYTVLYMIDRGEHT